MRFRMMISASVFLLATIVAARPASAACSNAPFTGVFGYFHGRLAGPGVPHGVVGQITSDGKGNLTGLFTDSSNGTLSTGTFTGTYSISSNCTGSLTFSSEVLTPTNFNIVLDNGKKGFQIILSDNNTTEPGFGIAQGTVKCGLPGKKLTLATNLFGTLTSSGDQQRLSDR
ncbi:MAG: hypothetical protein ABSD75_32710 [Terriglobales bacterium]|jgi:hypothetical protein